MLCPVCAHIPAGQYFLIGLPEIYKAATLSTGVIGPKWAGFTNFYTGLNDFKCSKVVLDG